jgi:hypothetical protein
MNLDLVVVAGRLAVLTMGFDDREGDAVVLDLAICPPTVSQPFGPSDFEPDQVIGVVDHSHLVGLCVPDA